MRHITKANEEMKIKKENVLFIMIFSAPFALLFLFFILFPIFEEIYYAFVIKLVGLPPRFTGLSNFKSLLRNPLYVRSLLNTLFFVSIVVNTRMLLALALAVLLNQEFKGRKYVRALMILPWALPIVPALLTWRWMFNPDYGLINELLLKTGLIKSKVNWFGTYSTAFAIAILFPIWKFAPFWASIFLARLQAIPRDLYEAAIVDGARPLQTFRYITLPHIKDLYVLNTLLSTIWTMGDFITIYLLTGGGPAGTTHVLATIGYMFAFQLGNLGVASAAFVFVLPIIIPLIMLIMWMLERAG